MIRKTRLMTIALISILVLSTSLMGCIDQQISSRFLIDGVRLAEENLDSYEIQMDIAQGMNGTDGDQSLDTDNTYHMSIRANRTQQTMHIEAASQSAAPEDLISEVILVSDTYYTRDNTTGVLGVWMEAGTMAGAFESQDWVKQPLSTLESSDFEIIGTERINGVEAYVTVLHPNTEAIITMASQYITPQLLMYAPDIDSVIPKISVKQWYDQETFLPVKSSIEMSIILNEDTLGIDAGIDAAVDIRQEINIVYYQINKPVVIEAPQLADAASNNIDDIP